jgi:phospholipase/carboxylesterase
MFTFRQQQLGGLDCVIADDDERRPEFAAVFMHGFGASGEDLVPLEEEFILTDPSLTAKVRFIFPAAPLEPPEFAEFGGRAWWPLDIAALQLAIAQGEFRDLRRDVPPLLSAAREKLVAAIHEIEGSMGIPVERTVLGGFSQGSMLATDVALRLDRPPAALVVWSGTLLAEEEWKELAPRRAGLKVLQSHGQQDQILPFMAAEWLRDMLTDAGLDVDFTPFNGPHTIPRIAIQKVTELLGSLR